jgi:two-component system, LytTR family, response regulator
MEKIIRCIIIEDEPLAADRLKDYISRMQDLRLDRWFESGKDAVTFLETNKPDLIFLDLHLGESSGIKLMEQGKITGKIIVTTAYPEYAIKGYDLDIADYILKPFVFERFETAVRKALRKSESAERFIMIRSEYKQEKVFLDAIMYIEGMGDYRRIHTRKGRIMTLQTFREIEGMLESTQIRRIHKSYMVNVQHITSIKAHKVILTSQLELPVGDTYRNNLSE